MPKTAAQSPKLKTKQPIATMDRWKLEDAKAKFSEVVRLAGTDGPQLVTVRGKEAAVILAPETYRQLLPASNDQEPLFEFLRGLGLSEIDAERDFDSGREHSL
jgi:prevent-host-death family protein